MMTEEDVKINPECAYPIRREGFRQTPEIDRLIEALVKAQGQIKNAEKNQDNPHFKYRYADLASVWDAIRAPLTQNGLCIVQGAVTGFDEGVTVTVTTRLMHTSGQWLENEVTAEAGSGRPQEVGSAFTYMKRYAISGMTGCVAEDDDDGETVEGRRGPEGRPQSAPPRERSGGKQPPKDSKPAGAKLTEKELEAVKMAFEQFKIPLKDLEEKFGIKSPDWTEKERVRAVSIYKELEAGTRKEDIFGQKIDEPKAKDASA